MKTTVLFGLALACITALSSTVSAQIYRSTDANGNVIFTDTPPPGGSAEQVNLQRTNSAEPTVVPPPVSPVTEEASEEIEAAVAQTVVITSPANEETIPMGAGDFSVVARVEPDLGKGQSLQLSLDGTPTGKLMQSGFWDLTSVPRGAHDLTVSVVDSSGKIFSTSNPVRIYVMRPSVNQPAR